MAADFLFVRYLTNGLSDDKTNCAGCEAARAALGRRLSPEECE
jgi:hypothetical protein